MTKAQYEALNIGDIVTRTNGPNKNVLMKVIDLDRDHDNGKRSWILAKGLEPNTVYSKSRAYRDLNMTSGCRDSFIFIRKADGEKVARDIPKLPNKERRTHPVLLRLSDEEYAKLKFISSMADKASTQVLRALIEEPAYNLGYYNAKENVDE